MAQSFQKEKPPARINLFLDVLKNGAQAKQELPLRKMVMGDFTGREDSTPVEDREVMNINKDNFESVMKAMELKVNLNAPDRLRGGDEEMKVDLKIEKMDDFRPESVARQVPELNRLMAMRNLLQDLRNRVVSTSDFRKQLEKIVKDKAALAELSEELDKLVKANDAAQE